MPNKYEQRKQIKNEAYENMETNVSPEALAVFRERAYRDIRVQSVKGMLETKHNLNYLISNAGKLDDWETETVRRIMQRVQRGGDAGGNDKGETRAVQV